MSEKEDGKSTRARFLIAPYRLIGKRLTKFLPFFEGLRTSLMKADLKIDFSTYVAYMLFFSGLAFITVLVATFILGFMFGASIMLSLLLGLAFGLLGWVSAFAALYIHPVALADSRKRYLEVELPYLVSHMAILSQAGMVPEKIFRSLSTLDERGFKSVSAVEAKNIVRDVHVLGCDVITAMERSTHRSPSKKFSDIIRGLISVTRSGGDMTQYFLSAARGLMDSSRIAARQLSDTLGTIAELYVSIMIVFPLVIVIMLAIMGLLGGTVGGMSIMTVLYLVTYALVHFLALSLLVFLDGLIPPR